MERFVFVVAVAAAVLFGIGAVFGGPHFNFSFDEDGVGSSPVMAVSAGRLEQQAFAGSSLRVRGTAANITVIPEDRTDFLVEIDNSAGRTPMPEVTADEEGFVLIDGHLRGRIHDCEADTVDLRGYGEIALTDLPTITIRAPRALVMDRAGAGSTEIGATQSLAYDYSGCGNSTLADVAGDLSIDLSGSGVITGGSAQSLDLDLAGSGDVTLGAIAQGASIDIAGSGTVTLASLTGPLSTDGAGSGNVDIAAGAIDLAEIDLAGSGGVSIGATVQTLNVNIVGSGDVDVTAAVGDIDAEIAGSGSVTAASASGTVSREIWGSGEVTVGR